MPKWRAGLDAVSAEIGRQCLSLAAAVRGNSSLLTVWRKKNRPGEERRELDREEVKLNQKTVQYGHSRDSDNLDPYGGHVKSDLLVRIMRVLCAASPIS